MLSHPTHERLISLGLPGMAKAFDDQRRSSEIAALSFEERIGLMVDREAAERDSKRLSTRLKFAALRQNAVVEEGAIEAVLENRAKGGDGARFYRDAAPAGGVDARGAISSRQGEDAQAGPKALLEDERP